MAFGSLLFIENKNQGIRENRKRNFPGFLDFKGVMGYYI